MGTDVLKAEMLRVAAQWRAARDVGALADVCQCEQDMEALLDKVLEGR